MVHVKRLRKLKLVLLFTFLAIVILPMTLLAYGYVESRRPSCWMYLGIDQNSFASTQRSFASTEEEFEAMVLASILDQLIGHVSEYKINLVTDVHNGIFDDLEVDDLPPGLYIGRCEDCGMPYKDVYVGGFFVRFYGSTKALDSNIRSLYSTY